MSKTEIVVHVVDDEETVRASLAFLLDAAGYAVRTHASAESFLEIAAGLGNGCLVTDLRMPDIDGVELLKRLNAMSAMLPTIVVTGHGDVQMAVEAMKNGAMDFIEKPFSKETILDSIRRAVDRAGANFQLEQTRTRVLDALALLSERERQVLAGVAKGQPNKVIAFELGISPRTVEGYRATLMAKMQARTLAELVRMTMDAGLDPGSLAN
jgi:two-component system, LuxR family, response regulator FixJ